MLSTYEIQIDDDAITEQVINILNAVFKREMMRRYDGVDGEVRQAVKDMVYSHKDEIIERVVERASRELVKRGMPLLMEKICADGERREDADRSDRC